MRSSKLYVVLLSGMMMASMSIATSKANTGNNHSPPAAVTLHTVMQDLISQELKTLEQLKVAVMDLQPVSVQETNHNVQFTSLIDQKGGSQYALGYWKVNRCRLCK